MLEGSNTAVYFRRHLVFPRCLVTISCYIFIYTRQNRKTKFFGYFRAVFCKKVSNCIAECTVICVYCCCCHFSFQTFRMLCVIFSFYFLSHKYLCFVISISLEHFSFQTCYETLSQEYWIAF